MSNSIIEEVVHVKHTFVYTKIQKQYRKKILLQRGGSSSSKTWSTLLVIAKWLLTGTFVDQQIPSWVATIARKYATSLAWSVMKDWDDLLALYGWDDYVVQNKTHKRYYFWRRYVEFIGLDDPQKMKGPRREIWYINEITECDPADFFQFELRTRKRLIIDFNPDDEEHWVNTKIEQERAIKKGDVDILISTYRDNQFLTPSEIESIEYYREVDPQAWAVYGLWQYGKIKGRIFEHFEEVDWIDDTWKFCGHGLDFWYTNDPTSMIQLYERNWGKEILLDELIYETGLTNPQISEVINEYNIPYDDQIIADSSEPKSIRELVDLWHNVQAVKKGEDSVRFWISLMKWKKIFVTRTSIKLKRELKKYTWKALANWEYSRQPIDKNNHAIDAARYICMWYFWERDPEPQIFISSR